MTDGGPVETAVIHEHEPVINPDTVKVSWGAIFAGMVVALGAWVLLTVLGLAVGLTAVDQVQLQPSSMKSAGIATGVWSLVVPFVALLAGGLVAARTAGLVSRPTGAVHGVVLWALATIASVALVGYVVKGVAGTALGLGTDVVGAAGSAATERQVRTEELLGPINEKLRAEGKPTVSAAQLDATVKQVASTGLRQGGLDRDAFITALANNTALSRADAEDVANRLEAGFEQKKEEVQRSVETGATRVVDTTGKAMWWVFAGMLLGLGSAVVGSTLGVSRKQRLAATAPYVAFHPEHAHP